MPTANISKPLHEELQLLSHAVEGDTFHFVVVQWAHYSLIQKTKDYLRQQFPERPASTVHVKDIGYELLMAQILTQAKGFVFLDDFENLLTDTDLYVAFNQRRGKLARFPLSIVTFIPPGERYVTQLAKAIPDWWSVLTFLAMLENTEGQTGQQQDTFQNQIRLDNISTLGGPHQEDRLAEIMRLQKRLADTEIRPENASLLNQFYRQILDFCKTSGLYQLGLVTANEWLKVAFTLDYENTDPEVYSQLLGHIGSFEQYLGHYDRARSLMEEALALDLSRLGLDKTDHSTIAIRQSNLANVYRDLGEYEKARDLLKSALDSNLKNFGAEHLSVAICQSNLALVFRDLGDYEKARDLMESTLLSHLKNFEAGHPNIAVGQANLANIYRDLGEYEKARDLLESALASQLKNFGAEHPNVASSQSNLATVYLNLGDYEKARELLESALASDLKNFGAEHPNVASSQSNLATVYQNLGDYEKALCLLESALASDLKNFGAEHPSVAFRQDNLGAVYLDMGEKEKAKGCFKRAFAILQKQLGEQHPDTQNAKKWLIHVNT